MARQQLKKQSSTAVPQEYVDMMIALRKQGYFYATIAKKIGYAYETVRRYVKHVKPEKIVDKKKNGYDRTFSWEEAWRLHTYADMTHVEIAERFGITPGWSKEVVAHVRREKRKEHEAQKFSRSVGSSTGCRTGDGGTGASKLEQSRT